jgi:hypothetical protein
MSPPDADGINPSPADQAKRYVEVFTNSTHEALAAVNAEAKDPTACAVDMVAYIRGAEVSTVRDKDSTYRVTEITVVASHGPYGFRPIVPTTQFTIFKIDEEGRDMPTSWLSTRSPASVNGAPRCSLSCCDTLLVVPHTGKNGKFYCDEFCEADALAIAQARDLRRAS